MFFALALPALVLSAPPLSDRVVDYEIEATLDAPSKRIQGRETVTWRNESQEPQKTLWFHLYWNAFKNTDATASREAFTLGGYRDASPADAKPSDWGYSDVKSIAVKGGADLLPSLRFQHPDDDNDKDQTVFTVELPTPVPPGGKVTLDIAWEAKVPKAVARAGYEDGGYFLISQWFPKLGVLEVPPTRGVTRPRWNCHQYHVTSEFYADFGTYDVEVTVPKELVVGGVGERVGREVHPDGTVTHHFHQDDVHDFAWTAWKDFKEVEDVFDEPGVPKVRLTALLPKWHRDEDQLFAALKWALHDYGHRYGPYPFPHVTMVAPPPTSMATGGMEYLTFITVLSRRDPALPKDQAVWDTVIHEFGHNYFYGLLASNEFEEAWLDEGFTTYVTQKAMGSGDVRLDLGQLLPEPLRGWLGPILTTDLGEEQQQLLRHGLARWDSPVLTESWKFLDRDDYELNSYQRPGLNLTMLERLLGPERMGKVMRAYVDRFRFRHPSSADFFEVASEVSGEDLSGFAKAFFKSAEGFDMAVSDVKCEVQSPKSRVGVFDLPDGGKQTMSGKRDAAPEAEQVHHCFVTVKRREATVRPVELAVTFDDGSSITEHWDGVERWHRFFYSRKGKGGAVKEARVDPRAQYPVDADPNNNALARKGAMTASLWTLGWLGYVGQLLGVAAGGLF
jgi:hypothetical protein